MHMGLTNSPDVQFRAELLSHFMLRKIPNSIVDEDENPHQDVFAKKRESQKLQSTTSASFVPMGRTSQKYSAPAGSGGPSGRVYTQTPFHGEHADDDEEDTNGEFLPSGGRYKAPVAPPKKTICITRIPFVQPLVEDVSEKSTDIDPRHEMAMEDNDNEDEVQEFDAPAAFDTTMKKSIFTTKNKLGANTVFTSRGTSSTIFTTKGAFKRGTMAIPFSAGQRIVPIAEAPTPPKKRSNLQRKSFIQAMNLDDMFCGDAFLFQTKGMTKTESTAAYAAISAAGCNSTQDLLDFLDSNRQQIHCTCGRDKKVGGSGRGSQFAHSPDCDSRMSGVWAESLVKMGIPAFHAMKIVECLKIDLK